MPKSRKGKSIETRRSNEKTLNELDGDVLSILPSFSSNILNPLNNRKEQIELLSSSQKETHVNSVTKVAEKHRKNITKRSLVHPRIKSNEPVLYFKRGLSFSHLLSRYMPFLLPRSSRNAVTAVTQVRRVTIHASGAAIKRALIFSMVMKDKLISMGDDASNIRIDVRTKTLSVFDEVKEDEEEEEEKEITDDYLEKDGAKADDLSMRERQSSAVEIVIERRPPTA